MSNTEKLSKNEFSTYKRVTNGVDAFWNFYEYMNENDLKTGSEDYLNFKNYKRGNTKDYTPIEKTERTSNLIHMMHSSRHINMMHSSRQNWKQIFPLWYSW